MELTGYHNKLVEETAELAESIENGSIKSMLHTMFSMQIIDTQDLMDLNQAYEEDADHLLRPSNIEP